MESSVSKPAVSRIGWQRKTKEREKAERVRLQVEQNVRMKKSKKIDKKKELTDMDEEAETKAIEKWLRIVDKPLATKEGDKKDAEPRDESDNR